MPEAARLVEEGVLGSSQIWKLKVQKLTVLLVWCGATEHGTVEGKGRNITRQPKREELCEAKLTFIARLPENYQGVP